MALSIHELAEVDKELWDIINDENHSDEVIQSTTLDKINRLIKKCKRMQDNYTAAMGMFEEDDNERTTWVDMFKENFKDFMLNDNSFI